MSKLTLDDEILHNPIAGRGLQGSTLAEEIGEGAHLLVFLRQFG
ncbi:MAG TPA: hypothetical protein VLV83_03775 [Acidobacteriota bacterium]|nr:hypothetical protein [Acidobacteriota bacterium]